MCSNFSTITYTEFSTLTNMEKDIVIDYISSVLSNNYLASNTTERYFGGALAYEKVILRDPLEFDGKDSKNIFLNTRLTTKRVSL